jgi:hypothetical protein
VKIAIISLLRSYSRFHFPVQHLMFRTPLMTLFCPPYPLLKANRTGNAESKSRCDNSIMTYFVSRGISSFSCQGDAGLLYYSKEAVT